MSYELSDEFVWKEIGKQVVVLEVETGAYWTLNDSASYMWKLLIDGQSENEVTDQMTKQFNVDEQQASTDIKEFLASCLQKNILVPSE